MAASNWTQPSQFGPPGALPWVEKYRAALLETNPQHRIGRIAEAFQAINISSDAASVAEERQAILDAVEVLRSLQAHSLSRRSASPWLL
jgi:hypothetical protein